MKYVKSGSPSKGSPLIRIIFRGSAFLGGLAFLMGCNNSIMLGGRSERRLEVKKVSTGLLVSALPKIVFMNQNGPGDVVTLPYESRRGTVPVACKLESYVRVDEVTPCACSDGFCSVGIRPQADVHGDGSFAFRLVDKEKIPSKLGSVKVKILPVTVSVAPGDSGDGQTGTVGEELSKPLVAFVKNSNGEPVKGVKVSWKVLDDEGSTTVCTKTSDSQGRAQCRWTLGTKVIARDVSKTRYLEASIFKGPDGAKNQEAQEPPPAQFTATAKPGPAVRLAFLPKQYPESRVKAGMLNPIGIYPQDKYGNLAETKDLDITLLAFKKEPGVPKSPAAPPMYGKLFSSFLPQLNKVGVYVLEAEDPSTGLEKATGSEFEIIPSKPAKLVFDQEPGGGTAGSIWAKQPKVLIQDNYGNKISDSVSVTLRAEGGSPKVDTLQGTSSVSVIDGIATFTDLKITEAGQYRLKASSPSLDLKEVESASFKITSASPNKLVFTQHPSGGEAGKPWAQQPKVALEDVFGNRVKPQSAVDVTVIIRTSVGNSLVQLPTGTTALRMVDGVASFENLSFELAGNYTLTAISSGFIWDMSRPFSITPGPGGKISFVNTPKSGRAGETLTPSPEVLITDDYGNQVLYSSNVNLTLRPNPYGEVLSGATNTVGGIATVKADKGKATFPNLFIKKVGVGYKLNVSIPGSSIEAPSSAFNISNGPATQMVFIQQPDKAKAGEIFGVQPIVEIRDKEGNGVTTGPDATADLTMSIYKDPAAKTGVQTGVLSGNSLVHSVGGQASWTDLSIDWYGSKRLLVQKQNTITLSSDGLKGSEALSILSDEFYNAANSRVSIPVNVKANAEDKKVVLRWSPLEEATGTGYDVYREEKPDGAFDKGKATIQPIYTDSSVENGKTYYYKVRAKTPGGNSEKSLAVPARPLSKPSITSLKVDDKIGSGALEVSWNASIGASSYTVSYSKEKGGAKFAADCKPLGISCEVKNLTPGETYYFVVNASNEYSGRVDSEEVSEIPREAPTLNLLEENGRIVPTFASKGATSYDLFYGEKSGNYTKTVTGAISGKPVANLDNWKTYFFKVVAKFKNGSLSSAERSGEPGERPGPFKITMANPSEESVNLSWGISLKASSYKVEYGPTLKDLRIFQDKVTDTSLEVTKLTSGVKYYFRVTAVNKYGQRLADNLMNTTTLSPPPRFVFTIQPSGGRAGDIWKQPVEVSLVDYKGRTVTSYSGPVELQVEAVEGGKETEWGCGDDKICFRLSNMKARAVNGVARFVGLTKNGAGRYRLCASDRPCANNASDGPYKKGKSEDFAVEGRSPGQFNRDSISVNGLYFWRKGGPVGNLCSYRGNGSCYNPISGTYVGELKYLLLMTIAGIEIRDDYYNYLKKFNVGIWDRSPVEISSGGSIYPTVCIQRRMMRDELVINSPGVPGLAYIVNIVAHPQCQ